MKTKTPRWLKWLGSAAVSALVKIADRDGDGKVSPGEVIALAIEWLEPHLYAHPEVATDEDNEPAA